MPSTLRHFITSQAQEPSGVPERAGVGRALEAVRHLSVADEEATAVVSAVRAALEAAIEQLLDERYEQSAA